jgi:hypothetical protein
MIKVAVAAVAAVAAAALLMNRKRNLKATKKM